jgi:hypothetical protein
MITIGSTQFMECNQEPKSPTYRGAKDDVAVSCMLMTRDLNDEQRWAAGVDLVGSSAIDSDMNGPPDPNTGRPTKRTWINRFLPWSVPSYQFFAQVEAYPPYVYATSFDAEPMNPADELDENTRPIGNYYKWNVRLTDLPYYIAADNDVLALDSSPLSYEPRQPDEGWYIGGLSWDRSRFISKRPTRADRVLIVKGGFCKLVNPNKDPVFQSFPKIEFRSIIEYTWWAVPIGGIPSINIKYCTGRVNHDTFDGYEAGTLLLASHNITWRRDWAGQRVAEITYIMGWLPHWDRNAIAQGWNSTFMVASDTGIPDFYPYSCDGTNDPDQAVYRKADLTTLFRPNQG